MNIATITPLPLTGAPYRLVDRAGRVTVERATWAQPLAEVNPYCLEAARPVMQAIVDAANAHRELLGGLRLLHATVDAFTRHPDPQSWNDMVEARATVRDILTRAS